MKTKTSTYLIAIATLLSITSCSIEKRHYRNGFNINWNTKQVATSSVARQQSASSANRDTIAATIVAPKAVVENKKQTIIKDSCDVIEMKNGNTVRAKVLEINSETVKYKNCGEMDGPDRVVEKDKIAGITYSSGKKENPKEFKTIKKEETVPQKNEPSVEKVVSDIKEKDAKKTAVTALVLGIIAVVILLAGTGIVYALVASSDIAGIIFGVIFGVVFGIAAIVLGVMAVVSGSKVLNKAKKDPEYERYKKLATAGLILGAAVLILILGGLVASGTFGGA